MRMRAGAVATISPSACSSSPKGASTTISRARTTRTPGERPSEFFRRVDLARAKAALAPIERLTPETAVPQDFVDLGDDEAFRPEVMDGECSA